MTAARAIAVAACCLAACSGSREGTAPVAADAAGNLVDGQLGGDMLGEQDTSDADSPAPAWFPRAPACVSTADCAKACQPLFGVHTLFESAAARADVLARPTADGLVIGRREFPYAAPQQGYPRFEVTSYGSGALPVWSRVLFTSTEGPDAGYNSYWAHYLAAGQAQVAISGVARRKSDGATVGWLTALAADDGSTLWEVYRPPPLAGKE